VTPAICITEASAQLSEGRQLSPTVRDWPEHTLHPIAILLQSLHIGERFGLRRERRSRVAVGFANLPTLSGLTGDEELIGDLGD
jgi:hypothetical protein